jgi:xanthine/uracil/vitamin C permease (AzgA family)
MNWLSELWDAINPSGVNRHVDTAPVAAGIALFLSVFYCLHVNAALLEQVGLDADAVLTGTLIVVILLTGLSFTFLKLGFFIAPGIGISLFVVQFNEGRGHSGEMILATLLIVGIVFLLLMVFTSVRRRLISNLPTPVKSGVIGILGSLFLAKGSETLKTVSASMGPHLTDWGQWAASTVGDVPAAIAFVSFGAMALGYVVQRHFEHQGGGPSPGLFGRAAFGNVIFGLVVAVVLTDLATDGYFRSETNPVTLSFEGIPVFAVLNTANDIVRLRTDPSELLSLSVFAFAMLFVLVTDMSGTPRLVADERDVSHLPGAEHRFRGSFIFDGLGTVVAPLMGTSSPVHYAENHLLHSFNSYQRRVSGTVLVLFVMCLGALWAWPALSDAPFDTVYVMPGLAQVALFWFLSLVIFVNAASKSPPLTRDGVIADLEDRRDALPVGKQGAKDSFDARIRKVQAAPLEGEGNGGIMYQALPPAIGAFVSGFTSLELGLLTVIGLTFAIGSAFNADELVGNTPFKVLTAAAAGYAAILLFAA